jgi:hypothetical protein
MLYQVGGCIVSDKVIIFIVPDEAQGADAIKRAVVSVFLLFIYVIPEIAEAYQVRRGK